MHRLLIYPLRLFALQPLWLQLFWANVLAFVLQHLIRYRRKVVISNITRSFPNQNSDWVKQTASQFYTHLADRIIESVVCVGISKQQVLQRCPVKNYELVDNYGKQGKDVIAVLGHCGAWELACLSASIYIDNYTSYAVYTQPKSKLIDNFLNETRGRFGMQLYSMQQMPFFLKNGFGKTAVGMYLADQSHSNPARGYWTTFLHQDTVFMNGPARFAIARNCAIIFVKVKQLKRGYYEIENVPIADNAADYTEKELTEKFVRLLEQQITELPSDWLWSHKRWKHQRTPKG